MKRIEGWAAVMTAVALAACGGDTADALTPAGPMLLVGPTSRVEVFCPDTMEAGTSATCHAYGYDANGSFTNSSASSWSSGSTGVATITSSGNITAVAAGTATITAYIDGVGGNTGVTVVPAPLSVAITFGQNYVWPGETCMYVAQAQGGTQPYSWSWTGGSPVSGANSSRYTTQAFSNFTARVIVTDALGAADTASMNVGVSSKGYPCA